MPTLYVKTGCPFCAKVRSFAVMNGITFDERNIGEENYRDELLARGGKVQVPYLVDGDVSMYESDDIVAYLQNKISPSPQSNQPRVHRDTTSGVCPS